MNIKPGDRIMITKYGHPADGQAGIALGWDSYDGTAVLFVASCTPRHGRVWPVYMLRPHHVELIESCNEEDGGKLVESIIDEAENRGCPLRGIYRRAGPYVPKHTISG
jgi:hypothetical protein